MRWIPSVRSPVSLLALAAGCGDARPDAPTWTRDVSPIVLGRCADCHHDGGIGPFPLTTYEEVRAVEQLVSVAVSARTMPPWRAVAGHQRYQDDRSLTEEQIATIVDWVDAGSPEGDPDDQAAPLPSLAVTLPRVDQTLTVPEPYLPRAELSDDYRCFLVPWEGSELSYVTGFEVFPDNSSVVHHVAAFLVRPDTLLGEDVFEAFAAFDEAEEGPGYTCFGGPSGEEELQIPIQQVAQWVPGSGAVLFPEGVGIAVPAGSAIVVQLHYHLDSWNGGPDQTHLELMTSPTVERLGAFAPYLDATWAMGTMPVPAGEITTHAVRGDPVPFFDLLLSDIELGDGFDIFAAMLHMHTLGVRGEVGIGRSGGGEETLLEVDPWDFDWQLNYQLATPVRFSPGDELRLSCTFDNVEGTSDRNWGEGSEDEMCVGNLFVAEPFPDGA